MSIALIAHLGSSAGTGTTTTSSIDTTGATLIVINRVGFVGSDAGIVSDSKNNTWVALPVNSGSGGLSQFFLYCINPTVGTGHTFTITSGANCAIEIAAFSGVTGVLPFDQSTSAIATSSTIQPGSLTPANINSLVITGVAIYNSGPTLSSINGGFTITDTNAAGSNFGGSLAYLIQTSAVAANPTWTFSGSLNLATTMAVFIAGTSTPPASPALVAHTKVAVPTTATTPAIDTTGATLLVANVSFFSPATSRILTDSNSNTWTQLTVRGSSFLTQIYYCINPIVGAGHTFTLTNGNKGGLEIAAFSGTGAFDVEGGGSSTGFQGQGSSVTPSVGGSLILTAICLQNVGNSTSQILYGVDEGFKIIDTELTAFNQAGSSLAWLPFTPTSALNPKWAALQSGELSIANAIFKPASGNLTEIFSDSLSLSDSLSITSPILGTVLSDTLSLSDNLINTLSFLLKNGDTLTLSDSLLSAFTLIISESFTLGDLLNYGLSLPISGNDSLGLSDAIIFLIGIGLGKSDTITFSDVLNIGAGVARLLGDNILLSDFLAALIQNLPTYSDNFSLSDSATLALSLGIFSTDSFVLSDAVQIAIANNLTLSKTDSLNLSDDVTVILSSSMDQYIRHYLNDVQR